MGVRISLRISLGKMRSSIGSSTVSTGIVLDMYGSRVQCIAANQYTVAVASLSPPKVMLWSSSSDDVANASVSSNSSLSVRSKAFRRLNEHSLPSAGVSIALGSDHGAVACSDGSLHVWGLSAFGQLGLGDDVPMSEIPVPVPFPSTSILIRQVVCGWSFTLALCRDGDVYSWGAGGNGQLGHGDGVRHSHPTRIRSLERIATISAGETHAAAVNQSGVLFSWGCGDNGRLGHGSSELQMTPKAVVFPAASAQIVDVACGNEHTIAVDEGGNVYSWGSSRSSRLGYPSSDNADVLSPQVVPGLPANVKSVACGNRHSGCLTRDGAVWLWGMFTLGDGLVGRQSWAVPAVLPIRVHSGETIATRLVCTPNSVIVETEGGSVLEWGSSGPVVRGESSTLLPKDQVKDAVVVASRTLHHSPLAPLAVAADTSSASLLFPHERSPVSDAIVSKLSPMLSARSSSPQTRPGALQTMFSSPPTTQVPPPQWDRDSSENDLEYEHVPVASVSLSLDDFSESPAFVPRVDVLGNVLSPVSGPRLHTTMSTAETLTPLASPPAVATVTSDDPALLESFQALSHKLVAVHVRSALSTVVHGVAKSNLAALSAAFRRWATACVSAQLSESFASESRGDVTVSSAPARILDPSCAPAIVMRRCILLCRQRRLRSAIAVWKRFLSASVAARVATESGFSKAAELYQKSNEELVEKMEAAKAHIKKTQQQMRLSNDRLALRLMKMSLMYGRDKVIAVLEKRKAVNVRVAFMKWRMTVRNLQRAEAARRQKQKFETSLASLETDRRLLQQGMSELTVQRAHTVAHLAFQQWKLAQIHRAMLKRESELLEQRDKLMGLLQTVLARLEDRNNRAAVVEKQAIANGVSLMDHVKSLRESLSKLKDATPSLVASPVPSETLHVSPLVPASSGERDVKPAAAPSPSTQGLTPRPPPPRPSPPNRPPPTSNSPKPVESSQATSPAQTSEFVNPMAALKAQAEPSQAQLPPSGFVTSQLPAPASPQKPAWYQNVTETIASYDDEPPPPRPLPGSTSEEKYVDVIAAAFGSESRKIGGVIASTASQLLSSTSAAQPTVGLEPVPVLTQNVFASLSSGPGVSSWAAMMAKRRQQAPPQ